MSGREDSAAEQERPPGRLCPERARRSDLGGLLMLGASEDGPCALEQALERLELVLAAAGEGIYGTDLDDRLVFVNPAGARLLGWTQAELVGRPAHETIHHHHPDGRPYPLEACPVHETTRDRQPRTIDDEVLYRRDGSTIPVDYVATPLVQRGVHLGTVVVFSDATERRRSAEELRRAKEQADAASRAKSAFLAAMSHEIRTPLNGMLGMLEILALTPLDDSQRSRLSLIRDSASSLLAVINEVLDFSKIEAEMMALEVRPLELRATIESAAQLFAAVAERKDIGLRCFVDARIQGSVEGDALRLRQVLNNLLSNAIKFTEKGEVCLLADLLDGPPGVQRVRIRVTDTGIGIAPENLDKLFKPFSQAECSTTRRFGGTGLGLAISARFVEMMGGHIEVESKEGAGTTMSVVLELPVSARPAAEPAGPSLAGVHVLVASDDRHELTYIPGWLERWDAVVTPFVIRSGSRRLRLPPGVRPDIILCAQVRSDVAWTLAAECPGARVVLLKSSVGMPTQDLSTHQTIAPLYPRARLVNAVAIAAGRASHEDELTQALSGFADSPGPSPRKTRAAEGASAPAPGLTPVRPTASADSATLSVGQVSRRRILVAEDHPVNQRVLLTQLEILGFEVTLVGNGAEAHAAWRAADYDLVITDCHMPVMDGYALAEAIRREEVSRARRTPIIALTANSVGDDDGSSLSHGMDAFLTKPVEMRVLKDAVDRVLTSPEAAGEPQIQILPAEELAEALARGETIDLEALHATVGADPDLVRETLRDYLLANEADAEELRAALDARDPAWAASTAHRMKGAARIVGAEKLAEELRILERAGREGDWARLTREAENTFVLLGAVERRARDLAGG